MNHDVSKGERVRCAVARVLAILLFMFAVACDNRAYVVILVVDARVYRPAMTWDEIRESSFVKPYAVRVYDAARRPVPLYRYNHDKGGIMLLDEPQIHISTPIIFERKYDNVYMEVLDHGDTLMEMRVAISDLKPLKGGLKAYVLPVEMPVNQ